MARLFQTLGKARAQASPTETEVVAQLTRHRALSPKASQRANFRLARHTCGAVRQFGKWVLRNALFGHYVRASLTFGVDSGSHIWQLYCVHGPLRLLSES
jgi:hypothetical protein